jgi:hypothetical protein
VLGVAAVALVLLASGCVLKGTWTDTAFSPVGATDIDIRDVACAAADDCLGVGFHGPWRDVLTVQRWDGSAWTPVAGLPNAGGDGWFGRAAVSCWTSDGCMLAVAEVWDLSVYERTFVWDGVAFSEVSAPDAEIVDQLDCWAADGCTAWTGDGERAFGWDGSGWGAVVGVGDASVSGAICFDEDSCIVPRAGLGTVLHVEDGTVIERPAPFGLWSLACASEEVCHATSEDGQRLAEWDGTSWAERTLVQPAGQVLRVTAIDCSSPTACLAVGYRTPAGGAREPVSLGWWGADEWARTSVPASWVHPTASTASLVRRRAWPSAEPEPPSTQGWCRATTGPDAERATTHPGTVVDRRRIAATEARWRTAGIDGTVRPGFGAGSACSERRRWRWCSSPAGAC